jgi:hypothetical protein
VKTAPALGETTIMPENSSTCEGLCGLEGGRALKELRVLYGFYPILGGRK